MNEVSERSETPIQGTPEQLQTQVTQVFCCYLNSYRMRI